MSRLKVAAQLIKDTEYKLALDMLKRDESSLESFYWRSLICRLLDLYDEEKKIIDLGVQRHGSNAYLRERSAWHKLPVFERMVPRQPLRMPRNPLTTPPQSVLDQLCFVTGGDSGYFSLIVECIESIRGTFLYKDTPVCVLDCGLTDDQKHYLTTILNVVDIKDPGWQYQVDGFRVCDQNDPKGKLTPLHPGLKAIMSKAFLHDIFPNYRFVFWLDADSWIHDERAIDRHLDLCCKQSVAFAYPDPVPFEKRMVYQFPVIEDQYKKRLAKSYHITSTQFVVDADSGFFEDWKKYLDYHVRKYGFWRAIDEESAMIAMQERGSTDVLDERSLYTLYAAGLPVIKDNSQVLYHPMNGQVVGIMSLFHNKFAYYWPTLQVDSCLNDQQLQQHIGNYNQLLQAAYQGKDPCELMPNHPKISQRYRVYPWEDKPLIQKLLNTEAKACHA